MNRIKALIAFTIALLTLIYMMAMAIPTVMAESKAGSDDAGLPTPLLITEVCYNPTFITHDKEDLISATADVLEFVEIYNPTSETVSLKNAVIRYSNTGYDGKFKENTLAAVSTSEMTIASRETAIICIYGSDAAIFGLTYDTDEGIQEIFELFGQINVNLSDSLSIEEFIIAPKTKSGIAEKVAETAFNLDNESQDAVIRLVSGETLLCETHYNAALWNRNICSVNMIFDSAVDPEHPNATVPFNETYPTPGYLYENQYPNAVLSVEKATENLLVFEYNICASESSQKNADGSAVSIGQRMDKLESMIAQYQPDVISLPEFNNLWLPEMKEYLAAEGCVYTAFGASSQGKEFGKKDTNYKWDLVNLIMYNHNKYDLLDSGYFWCSRWPDRRNSKIWEDGTDGDLARCINWVILRDKETQAEFMFVSAHIDAKIPLARTYSTDLITKKATELAKGRPVIMAGDWNCHESTEAYWNLHKNGYADARYRTDSVANMSIYSTMNKWGESTDLQTRPAIDHCIISKDSVMVNSAHRDMGEIAAGIYASDHNATVFDLSFVNINAVDETLPSETDAPTVSTTASPETNVSKESETGETPVTDTEMKDTPAGGCAAFTGVSVWVMAASASIALTKKKKRTTI